MVGKSLILCVSTRIHFALQTLIGVYLLLARLPGSFLAKGLLFQDLLDWLFFGIAGQGHFPLLLLFAALPTPRPLFVVTTGYILQKGRVLGLWGVQECSRLHDIQDFPPIL